MYLVYGLFSALLGLAISVLIRLELAAPGVGILHNDNQLYNTVVTAHAFLIIFFFVIPSAVGGFGNYLVPVMIGAADYKKYKYYSTQKQDDFNAYLAGL